MSFLYVDDEIYQLQDKVLEMIDEWTRKSTKSEAKRWFCISRSDIEKGFMAMRKGIYIQNG